MNNLKKIIIQNTKTKILKRYVHWKLLAGKCMSFNWYLWMENVSLSVEVVSVNYSSSFNWWKKKNSIKTIVLFRSWYRKRRYPLMKNTQYFFTRVFFSILSGNSWNSLLWGISSLDIGWSSAHQRRTGQWFFLFSIGIKNPSSIVEIIRFGFIEGFLGGVISFEMDFNIFFISSLLVSLYHWILKPGLWLRLRCIKVVMLLGSLVSRGSGFLL